jgi:hypothetical protein
VHPYRLHAPFSSLPEVRQYQLVRVPGGVHVRVVLVSSALSSTLGRVREALVSSLEAAGASDPLVAVEAVQAIDRERGHAAKLRLVA